MTVKQISVFLENKPGTMAQLTKVLSEHKIDMRALSLAEAADFGIVRLIVDEVYNAMQVLKDAGFIDKDIKNPKTNELFDDSIQIKITKVDNSYTYEVGVEC